MTIRTTNLPSCSTWRAKMRWGVYSSVWVSVLGVPPPIRWLLIFIPGFFVKSHPSLFFCVFLCRLSSSRSWRVRLWRLRHTMQRCRSQRLTPPFAIPLPPPSPFFWAVNMRTAVEVGRFHRWVAPRYLFRDARNVNEETTAVPFDDVLRDFDECVLWWCRSGMN